jgi:hypothetical protein
MQASQNEGKNFIAARVQMRTNVSEDFAASIFKVHSGVEMDTACSSEKSVSTCKTI